jgi:hypothetical protein
MKKLVDEKRNEFFVVNLRELKKLNNISINQGYNRNIDEESDEMFDNYKTSKFILNNVMVHNHKKGEPCDPHFRYVVYQLDKQNVVNTFFLDLPGLSIKHLLN